MPENEEEHEDDELLTGELKKKTQKIVSCKLTPFSTHHKHTITTSIKVNKIRTKKISRQEKLKKDQTQKKNEEGSRSRPPHAKTPLYSNCDGENEAEDDGEEHGR